MHVGVGEVLIGSLFFIYYFIEKARGTPKLTLAGGGEDQAAQEEAKTKPKARSRSSRSRIAHHCCAGLHGDLGFRKMRSGSGDEVKHSKLIR